jgi:spermidine synthase
LTILAQLYHLQSFTISKETQPMTPRIHLGTALVPGGDKLDLYSRGDDFMIVLDRNELMSTRMNGSEIALAEMTLERLSGNTAPHLLIGGYGMGFTLRAALAMMAPQGRAARGKVTVAELVPEIIAWARGPMAGVADGCLDDTRVRLVMGDVADSIKTDANAYDAILLDVDNGPDGLTRAGNDGLYSPAGLQSAKRALRPGGILAVWSAGEDKKFAKRLEKAGFTVEEIAVRARINGKGPRHIIWFAKKV